MGVDEEDGPASIEVDDGERLEIGAKCVSVSYPSHSSRNGSMGTSRGTMAEKGCGGARAMFTRGSYVDVPSLLT